MTAHTKDFIQKFPHLFAITIPEHRDKVVELMGIIENYVLRNGVAGGFVTAICAEDFIRAAYNADDTNLRYIGIYICFRDYLKDFQR